jgi:hypothetical protein
MKDLLALENDMMEEKEALVMELWSLLNADQKAYLLKTATDEQRPILEKLFKIECLSDLLFGEASIDDYLTA